MGADVTVLPGFRCSLMFLLYVPPPAAAQEYPGVLISTCLFPFFKMVLVVYLFKCLLFCVCAFC